MRSLKLVEHFEAKFGGVRPKPLTLNPQTLCLLVDPLVCNAKPTSSRLPGSGSKIQAFGFGSLKVISPQP